MLRRRGPLALIGMSSAIASPVGFATGAVGAAQLARLGPILRATRAAGLCRVLMIHHPPLEGTVGRRKRLVDGAALRQVLAREGVELVLHGHSHRSHFETLQTSDGAAPVIGVPSASSMHHEPAAYHLYRVTARRRDGPSPSACAAWARTGAWRHAAISACPSRARMRPSARPAHSPLPMVRDLIYPCPTTMMLRAAPCPSPGLTESRPCA